MNFSGVSCLCFALSMSFLNSTVATTLNLAEQHYQGIDFSSLSWLEKQWAAWYIWIGNPVTATGLMIFLLHEITYFGRCLPWMIVDALPYFRKWKLQPAKTPTPQEQWECTKKVLFIHFVVELPTVWLFHPVAEALGMATWQVPFPSWKAMVPQILLFFVLEDFFHYWAHRALHTGPLYKYIHKTHHKFSAPFGLATVYAHPAEILILGTGTIGGPILYIAFARNLHLFAVQIWMILRMYQAIDAHSGYGRFIGSLSPEPGTNDEWTDFPWSLHYFLPFWSGAEHHDFHHMSFTNNYSTSFRWWDRVFGTDTKYTEYRKKVKAAKATMKNVSQEERDAFERKLIDEVEKDGIEVETEVLGTTKAKIQ